MPAWSVAAVLLDMDGTLIDTEQVYLESTIAALAACGYTDGVAALCRDMIGLPGPECDRMLCAHFRAEYPADEVDRRYRANCAELLAAGLPLKPGVIELLDAIEASGLPKAIVTAATRHTAAEHLGLAGIAHRFDAILTRDDVAKSKPTPDLYLLAAERLGLRPRDCIAIEDSNPGVAAAHAAGAITLMVPDILPPTEETRARCAAVLPDLHAAIKLLTAHGALKSIAASDHQFIG